MSTVSIDARVNVVNISMDQGKSFTLTFTIRDSAGLVVDLTGCDARAQFRRDYTSTSTEINCTLANGKLVLENAANGRLQLVLAPTDTSVIKFLADSPEELELVYDVEVIMGDGTIFTPARGTLTLQREVTR